MLRQASGLMLAVLLGARCLRGCRRAALARSPAMGLVALVVERQDGAALTKPVTPRTLPARDEGSEMALSLARRRYGPALAFAEARYSFSRTRKTALIFEAVAEARTYERCASVRTRVKPWERSHDSALVTLRLLCPHLRSSCLPSPPSRRRRR
jgi:hypothetical protein